MAIARAPVDLEGALEKRRAACGFLANTADCKSAHPRIFCSPGSGSPRCFLLDPPTRCADQLAVHGPGEAAGHLVLQLRQVFPARAVEAIGPEMGAGVGVDELALI